MVNLLIEADILRNKYLEFSQSKLAFLNDIQKAPGYINFMEKQGARFHIEISWEDKYCLKEFIESESFHFFKGARLTLSDKNTLHISTDPDLGWTILRSVSEWRGGRRNLWCVGHLPGVPDRAAARTGSQHRSPVLSGTSQADHPASHRRCCPAGGNSRGTPQRTGDCWGRSPGQFPPGNRADPDRTFARAIILSRQIVIVP